MRSASAIDSEDKSRNDFHTEAMKGPLQTNTYTQ